MRFMMLQGLPQGIKLTRLAGKSSPWTNRRYIDSNRCNGSWLDDAGGWNFESWYVRSFSRWTSTTRTLDIHGHLRRVSVLSFCLLSSPEASNMVSDFILSQNKKVKNPCGDITKSLDITLAPIIMELENGCIWKVTTAWGYTHVSRKKNIIMVRRAYNSKLICIFQSEKNHFWNLKVDVRLQPGIYFIMIIRFWWETNNITNLCTSWEDDDFHQAIIGSFYQYIIEIFVGWELLMILLGSVVLKVISSLQLGWK